MQNPMFDVLCIKCKNGRCDGKHVHPSHGLNCGCGEPEDFYTEEELYAIRERLDSADYRD
jgi:hypothetical protein